MSDQPLMVLLGAGASAGHAPSTGDHTSRLLKWDQYEFKGKPLFRWIHDRARPYVGNDEFLDFEQLIHLCEVIAGLADPYTTPARNPEFWRPDFAFLTATHEICGEGNLFRIAAQDACEFILKETACNTTGARESPTVSVLQELATRFRLSVFSLNYDDIALHTGADYYTGFERDDGGNGRAWIGMNTAPVGHLYCSLHGSVRLGVHMKPGPIRPHYVRWHEDTATALQHPPGIGSGEATQDNAYLTGNPRMITGLRKSDKILVDPFASYFETLSRTLFATPKWVVLGYGFRDIHINSMLWRAREYWRTRQDEFHAVIVDQYSPRENDVEESEDEYTAMPGYPIHDVIYEKLRPPFERDFYNAEQQKAPLRLRLQRPQKLNDQVKLCLGGIDRFRYQVKDCVVNVL